MLDSVYLAINPLLRYGLAQSLTEQLCSPLRIWIYVSDVRFKDAKPSQGKLTRSARRITYCLYMSTRVQITSPTFSIAYWFAEWSAIYSFLAPCPS